MSFIFWAVILGVIPGMIAHSKGYSFGKWWLYGALLWIIALPHSLLLRPNTAHVEQKLIEAGMKKCPFCAEMIKGDAKVCRYCSRDLEPVGLSL